VYDPDPHAAQVIGDMLRAVPQRADEGLSGALAASGKPLVNNAVTLGQLSANVLEQIRPYLEQVGIRAMVLLPLIADGGYLGYLSMSRHGADRPYTDAEVRLDTDIAARVALTVATARSVQRLRASEEHYRRIVETSMDGVGEVDTGGVISHALQST
jgi:two-component system cell cycle sensor histidine kinase/response regulator CckA